MALVTVAHLREYLSQIKASPAKDEELDTILGRAEGIVTDALGITFLDSGVGWDDVTVSTKRVQSERSQYLKLPPYRAGSIVSIYVMNGTTTTTTAIDAESYEEQESGFYLLRPNGWGGVRYAVTATFGYGPTPASIVELILELAVNIHRQKGQGLFQEAQGVSTLNNSTGGGYIKYVGGLNADQRKILSNVLRKYRDRVQ